MHARLSTTSSNPNPVNLATASFAELIATIRDAHSDVVSAISAAIERALVAGQALNTLEERKLVRHGEWAKIYKQCDINERTAERYKQLARLAAANPSCTTDLAGLTIESAIKKLSPPKDGSRKSEDPPKAAPTLANKAVETTCADILAAWINAPFEERKRAIDGIGLDALLAAIPREWRTTIASPIDVAPPKPQVGAPLPDDLSIPAFLQRAPVNGGNQ